MMNKIYVAITFSLFVVFGCESEKSPVGPGDVNKTGIIVMNIVWPDDVVGKKNDVFRDPPDKITAYLYHSGKEIARTDLKHEETRGTAELTVAVLSGYRLDMIAFDGSSGCVLYTGLKDNITVSSNIVTIVDITMYDAAPVLNPIQKKGDNSYIIFWSCVPLATSYLLEESTYPNFLRDLSDEIYDQKLSTTVYSGSDTTKTFTNKGSGTFYYFVSAVFDKYAETYYTTSSDSPNTSTTDIWGFNMLFNEGAISNIISVQTGATSTMKIDILWPTK